ncbi:zeta toxin family protein [Oxalobacteraceae bacterium A2-2]
MAGLYPGSGLDPKNIERHVIVFGGPNGSGKTSLIDEVKATGLQSVNRVYKIPERFINPDQVAKDMTGNFPTQADRDRAAARLAVAERRQAISSGQSFAFETVLSHTSRISEMLYLKEQGYQVILTFITTDNPEKNVARVRLRYETNTTTGHFVAPDKVRDRYHRTLALLPKAVEVADAVFIYDNSEDFSKAQLQAIVEAQTGLAVTQQSKEWLFEKLIWPLQERQSARELHQLQVAELVDADELYGTYAGEITDVSDNYVVHFDIATCKHVIHDQLMLQTSRDGPPFYFEQGRQLRVQYAINAAPVVGI